MHAGLYIHVYIQLLGANSCVFGSYDKALIIDRHRALTLQLVHVQEIGLATHSLTKECASTTSSPATEKETFIALLGEAKGDFDIGVMTTDGHTGIAKHMSQQESITHNLVNIDNDLNKQFASL